MIEKLKAEPIIEAQKTQSVEKKLEKIEESKLNSSGQNQKRRRVKGSKDKRVSSVL